MAAKKKMSKVQKKVSATMREFKAGKLHSGKGGPVVKSKKQALAIGYAKGRRSK